MKHALICEDDASIRTLVSTIVKREGFTVDLAENGNEAIEKIDKGCYDLVMLDLMMPGIDGYGVIQHIKERRPKGLKHVVVMTAVSEAIKTEFPEPICTLLSKPFDISKLSNVVRLCSRDCELEQRAGPNGH